MSLGEGQWRTPALEGLQAITPFLWVGWGLSLLKEGKKPSAFQIGEK